jgi:hypothetical protein
MPSFTAKPRDISATAATCAHQPAQYNSLPNQHGGTLLIHSTQCSHRPSAHTPQRQTQRSEHHNHPIPAVRFSPQYQQQCLNRLSTRFSKPHQNHRLQIIAALALTIQTHNHHPRAAAITPTKRTTLKSPVDRGHLAAPSEPTEIAETLNVPKLHLGPAVTASEHSRSTDLPTATSRKRTRLIQTCRKAREIH